MKCPSCGHENTGASPRVCARCSKPLAAKAPAPFSHRVRGTIQIPRGCPCCLGPADTDFKVIAYAEGNKRYEGGLILGGAVKDTRTTTVRFPICRSCLLHSRLNFVAYGLALLSGVAAFFFTMWKIESEPSLGPQLKEGGSFACCAGGSVLVGSIVLALVLAVILERLVPKGASCAASEYPVDADHKDVSSDAVVFKFTNRVYGARFAEANAERPPPGGG